MPTAAHQKLLCSLWIEPPWFCKSSRAIQSNAPLGRIQVNSIGMVHARRDHNKSGVMEFIVVHECMQLLMAVHDNIGSCWFTFAHGAR